LCEKWNDVVVITNGKDGPHAPENAIERQTTLLDILSWFSGWKILHDKRAQAGDANEFNFFADETYFCIRSLLLAHVAAIHMYFVEHGKKTNPRSMTTDAVE